LASLDKIISLKPTALYFSHFGKALNAEQHLEDYKIQLQLWAEIAEEGVKKNWSLEQIRDRIVVEDNAMGLIKDFIASHRIYSKTVLENCVRGFVEYSKQKNSS